MSTRKTKTIAATLAATNGDVSEKALRGTGLGGKAVRYIVKRLDDLGLTTRVTHRRQRLLVVPLTEVVQRLGDEQIPSFGANATVTHDVLDFDVMYMRNDPGGIYHWPERFPTVQVLGNRWLKPPEDAWYIGTRFERRRPGHPPEFYIYDGTAVVPERKK